MIVKLSPGVAYQMHAWGNADGGFEFAVIAQPVGIKRGDATREWMEVRYGT